MIVFALLMSLLAQTSQAVTIVHSNDVLGEIEPCGCRTNPLGGYARKANFLKTLKDKDVLQLDAGDLLFPSNSMPDVLKNQSLVQARWVMKVLDMIHVDAVTPGEKDFALGLPAFEKLIKGSKVKFLAANLKKRNGTQLLQSAAVFTRGDKRIAVIGLVGKDLTWPAGLSVTDPISAARALVPKIRKKVDYVVALTHQGLEADRNLAQAVPDIDIIIGGHTQSFLQIPVKVGKTVIYQSSFRNQYVGVLNLDQFPKEDSYSLVGLDANFDSPADSPGRVDLATKDFKADIAKANSEEDTGPVVKPLHAEYQTFPRCAECHLKQFDFWRKTPHALALAPLMKAGQDKNKECLKCHTVGMGDPKGWMNVMQLVQLRNDEHPEFLPNEKFVDYMQSVHDGKTLNDPVRGITALPGQRPEISIDHSLGRIDRAWTPVQCENCHGPGENHPMGTQMPKTVENKVCLSCHTQDRAPEWYTSDGKPDLEKIKAKHAMIACPAGEMSSE